MTELYEIFSTRELTILFYIVLGFLVLFLNKNYRPQLLDMLKTLFGKQIGTILLIQSIYVSLILYTLFKIGIWEFSLLKDTIFWYFATAMVIFFQINKAKETDFFIVLFKENLKWSIILEFIFNFYTFNIWVELLLLPIITFLVLLIQYSGNKKEYALTHKILQNTLSLIGLTFFAIVIFKTFINYNDVLTIHNLFSFLLPPALTILLIPFLYLLAIYMGYEELFNRTRTMSTNPIKVHQIKKQILLVAHFNLNRLNIISRQISKSDIYHSDDISSVIKTIVKDRKASR